MTADERQVRILDYVEAYQRKNGDAPTIREIVRDAGASTLANINQDVEALVRRGVLAFVTENVTGSEPFTSRQVKLSGPAAAQRIRAASPGPRNPASPSPAASAGPPAPGERQRQRVHRNQQPMPAKTGQPGSTQRPRPAQQRSAAAKPAFPFGPLAASGLADSLPIRAALIAAILSTLLLIGARFEQAPLPTAPAMQLGARSIPLVVPGAILAWALAGFVLARAAEAAGSWRWQGLLRAAGLGLLAGLFVLAYERSARPILGSIEASGLPRLLDNLVFLLPAVLPPAFAPLAGAATTGVLAAEIPKLFGGGYNYPFNNLVAIPLVVLPVELLLLARPGRRDRRTLMMVGVAAGLGQTLVSAAFTPGLHAPGMWPAVLVAALVGGLAAGWLVAWLRDAAQNLVQGLPRRKP